MIFFERFSRAVGILNDGIVEHCAKGKADFVDIFLTECGLFRLFILGQRAFFGKARQLVDSVEFFFFHNFPLFDKFRSKKVYHIRKNISIEKRKKLQKKKNRKEKKKVE